MKRFFLSINVVLSILFCSATCVWGELATIQMNVESMAAPEGVDSPAPRFSWALVDPVKLREGLKDRLEVRSTEEVVDKGKVTDSALDNFEPSGKESKLYNQRQSAYQIQAATSLTRLEKDQPDLWDSGRVESDQTTEIVYGGQPLTSSQVCYWRLKVWNQDGKTHGWSIPRRWVTGIMNPSDWQAKWIAAPAVTRPDVDLSGGYWIAAALPDVSAEAAAKPFTQRKLASQASFVKTFTLAAPGDGNRRYVLLRLAADREYDFFVNGQKAGFTRGHIFSPELLRQFDISEWIVDGENKLEVKTKNVADKPAAILAKIEIYVEPKNKTYNPVAPPRIKQSILTDDSWSANQFDGKPLSAGRLYDPDAGPWGKVLRRTEEIQPAFEKKFRIKDPFKIESAILHICGLGNYVAAINDEIIGTRVLDPAPTNYDKRVLYTTFDVTSRLIQGQDYTLYVRLGHSWYDMRTTATWNFDAAPWRDFPRMIAQLEIKYTDGTRETIVSDKSWSFCQSSHLYDCIRQGEIIDARCRNNILGTAEEVSAPKGRLVAQRFPGTDGAIVDSNSYLHPKAFYEPKPGVYVVDFGQNLSGRVWMRIPNAQPGDIIRLRYGERISPDKSIEPRGIACFFMEGSPSWYVGEKGQFQTDWYIARGNGFDMFVPWFVYHGFQYVEITGLRSKPIVDPDNRTEPTLIAQPLVTHMAKISSWNSSSELINKIQEATRWSYMGNFVNGVPTDCPHREKNGWTGDAQLAVEQAQYNFENTAAYRKWIDDLTDEQRPDGNLPGIVPTGGWGYQWGNGPAWDSALINIPWTIYCYRGDKRILTDNFDAMKRYVDYMSSRADSDGLVRFGLSDWCQAKTKTEAVVTSTGYYYLDAKIVAKAAAILGKTDEAKKYSELANRIRDDYNKVLYKGDGKYANESQCAQSCAIHQGMAAGLPADEQKLVFDRLTDAVKAADDHLDVGILGMKYLLRTLSEGGRTDLALKIMLQESKPSYADWIRRGGGTLWEDFNDGSSRNHIMYGDVSAWFFQYLAGIQIDGGASFVVADTISDSPAFKRFVVAPQCRVRDIKPEGVQPLKFVDARVCTPYGEICSAWKWNDDFSTLSMRVEVPVNTTATIVVPAEPGQKIAVLQGDAKESASNRYEVGSGIYRFEVTCK